MSSDCSITILECPRRDDSSQKEWRVQHLSSIHWELNECQNTFNNCDALVNKIRELFHDSPIFHDQEKMEEYCEQMFERLQQNGLPEYGDTFLCLTFNMWTPRKERE